MEIFHKILFIFIIYFAHNCTSFSIYKPYKYVANVPGCRCVPNLLPCNSIGFSVGFSAGRRPSSCLPGLFLCCDDAILPRSATKEDDLLANLFEKFINPPMMNNDLRRSGYSPVNELNNTFPITESEFSNKNILKYGKVEGRNYIETETDNQYIGKHIISEISNHTNSIIRQTGLDDSYSTTVKDIVDMDKPQTNRTNNNISTYSHIPTVNISKNIEDYGDIHMHDVNILKTTEDYEDIHMHTINISKNIEYYGDIHMHSDNISQLIEDYGNMGRSSNQKIGPNMPVNISSNNSSPAILSNGIHVKSEDNETSQSQVNTLRNSVDDTYLQIISLFTYIMDPVISKNENEAYIEPLMYHPNLDLFLNVSGSNMEKKSQENSKNNTLNNSEEIKVVSTDMVNSTKVKDSFPLFFTYNESSQTRGNKSQSNNSKPAMHLLNKSALNRADYPASENILQKLIKFSRIFEINGEFFPNIKKENNTGREESIYKVNAVDETSGALLKYADNRLPEEFSKDLGRAETKYNEHGENIANTLNANLIHSLNKSTSPRFNKSSIQNYSYKVSQNNQSVNDSLTPLGPVLDVLKVNYSSFDGKTQKPTILDKITSITSNDNTQLPKICSTCTTSAAESVTVSQTNILNVKENNSTSKNETESFNTNKHIDSVTANEMNKIIENGKSKYVFENKTGNTTSEMAPNLNTATRASIHEQMPLEVEKQQFIETNEANEDFSTYARNDEHYFMITTDNAHQTDVVGEIINDNNIFKEESFDQLSSADKFEEEHTTENSHDSDLIAEYIINEREFTTEDSYKAIIQETDMDYKIALNYPDKPIIVPTNLDKPYWLKNDVDFVAGNSEHPGNPNTYLHNSEEQNRNKTSSYASTHLNTEYADNLHTESNHQKYSTEFNKIYNTIPESTTFSMENHDIPVEIDLLADKYMNNKQNEIISNGDINIELDTNDIFDAKLPFDSDASQNIASENISTENEYDIQILESNEYLTGGKKTPNYTETLNSATISNEKDDVENKEIPMRNVIESVPNPLNVIETQKSTTNGTNEANPTSQNIIEVFTHINHNSTTQSIIEPVKYSRPLSLINKNQDPESTDPPMTYEELVTMDNKEVTTKVPNSNRHLNIATLLKSLDINSNLDKPKVVRHTNFEEEYNGYKPNPNYLDPIHINSVPPVEVITVPKKKINNSPSIFGWLFG